MYFPEKLPIQSSINEGGVVIKAHSNIAAAGMLSALSVGFALAGKFLPVAGIVFIILWPLPIFLTTWRLGLAGALYCLLVAEIMIFILIGPTYNAFLSMPSLVGIAIGLSMRCGYTKLRALSFTVMVSLVAFAANYFTALWVFNIDVMIKMDKATAVIAGKLPDSLGNAATIFIVGLTGIAVLFAVVNYGVAMLVARRLQLRKNFMEL